MDLNNEQDLNLIAERCGLLGEEKADTVIANILKLDESYEPANLVKIYNYFMTICKNPVVLSELVRCQDRIRDKASLPVLVDVLLGKTLDYEAVDKDAYTNVRVLCAKAIANLKDTTAVHALLYCLNNKNENYKVRFACADALGKIGDRFAVAPLIDVVKDEDEKSVYIRESAASALGMLGDMRAIDPLVSILETKNGLLDKFTFLKERILEALGKLNIGDDDRVFNAVKKSLMDESPQIRINAIEALMESDNPNAFETIKGCLNDSDDEVKRNALIALYNLSDRSILDEVINSPEYSDFLKMEAVSMIDEYESDDEEDLSDE